MKYLSLLITMTSFVLIPKTIQGGWIRIYGGMYADWGSCVRETKDGGYIVVGFTGSANSADIWLLKTDSLGDTLWTKIYGGIEADQGYCVQQTADDGYIITGWTEFFDGAWLLKTDSQGDTLWTRIYDRATGNWVEQTKDGGYIVTGHRSAPDTVPHDVWLLKVDANGNTQWSRRYGGWLWDEGYCVAQTEDGGYIVTGMTDSYGAGSADIWMLKTDSLGDTLWTRLYGGKKCDWSYSLDISYDGGYVIVGFTTDENQGPDWEMNDLWLLKLDAQGDTQWTRIYGEEDYIDQGVSVQQTSDSGYIITGIKDSEGPGTLQKIWLLKTDAQGDTTWTRVLGKEGVNEGASVRQTSDGGYIVTGHINNDLCLIKTDSLGYIGITEDLALKIKNNRYIFSTIGSRIIIRYKNCPQGLDASIFDVSGRKVDELFSTGSSGTIIWGDRHRAGVYFIRFDSEIMTETHKLILLK